VVEALELSIPPQFIQQVPSRNAKLLHRPQHTLCFRVILTLETILLLFQMESLLK